MAKRYRQRQQFPVDVSSEYMRRKLDPRYFFYEEYFIQRPGLNGDFDQAYTVEVARALNRNLEIQGNSSTTALCTALEGGGVTLTTAGADEDEMVITSHRDTDQSCLFGMNWDSANEPYILANVVTGATITDYMAKAVFASDSGAVDSATAELHLSVPADQFGFLFATTDAGATIGTTTNWAAISSRTGTDTSTDTSVTVAGSTFYRLEAFLDADRIPQFFINGVKVATADNTALTAVSTLDFYIEVMEEGSGAARALSIRNFAVSQLYG